MHAPIHPGENYTRKHNDTMQQPNADDIKIIQKPKRKPMPTKNNRRGDWTREEALKAIDLEQERYRKNREDRPTLVLKFPDPELNTNIVKGFSSCIENVHFQQPFSPR